MDALADAVTLFQFGFCVLTPLVATKGQAARNFPPSIRECIPYMQLSLVVFGATALATRSLVYVTYPTKVVFKSAKLIPTMIVSTLCSSRSTKQKKTFGSMDYLAAALLCAGAAGYSFDGHHNNSNHNSDGKEQSSSSYGILLLTISVICDAIVPNLQQKLMSKMDTSPLKSVEQLSSSLRVSPGNTTSSPMSNTSSSNGISRSGGSGGGGEQGGLSASALMVNVNVVGFVGLITWMIVTGSLTSALSAMRQHPLLLLYLLLIGVGLSTAVLAYTKLIQASGSVTAVAVATLRKVATVVLSYVLFPKTILPIHMASALLVLAGVLLHTFYRPTSPSA
uniref:Sugar phosphate transporter domain-containing protein n=1 Tax=Attheya septentrionalis TaxID=420275 RepID=A0A7S2UHY5_9STRA